MPTKSPTNPNSQHKKPPFLSKKTKFKFLVLLPVVLITSFALAVWWFWEIPLTSPVGQFSSFKFLKNYDNKPSSEKIVYGFAPYWNLKKINIQPELTRLAYFSLTIGADGSLLQNIDDEPDPGFNRLTSDDFMELGNQTLKQNGGVDLVLTQFNSDDISVFLTSESAQQKLLNQLDSILLAYPFGGINIDIEPSGAGSGQLRDRLTSFVKLLRTHLDEKYSHITISIDMYASAINSKQIWDVEALSQEVDYIIIMAYDFHRRNSPQAGPVAPLFGGRELWDGDINHYLQSFVKAVPRNKILLGVPFYGYEWQTTSRDAQSHTFPDSGATASIERVDELLKRKAELEVQEHWSEEALSPYLSYKEGDDTYIIYYENPRSISYKLDYVNQLDIAGIAIWALGYEGNSRDLWEVVGQKFQ